VEAINLTISAYSIPWT